MSLLVPCPGCGETRKADEGHHLCRRCEGYRPATCVPLCGASQVYSAPEWWQHEAACPVRIEHLESRR